MLLSLLGISLPRFLDKIQKIIFSLKSRIDNRVCRENSQQWIKNLSVWHIPHNKKFSLLSLQYLLILKKMQKNIKQKKHPKKFFRTLICWGKKIFFRHFFFGWPSILYFKHRFLWDFLTKQIDLFFPEQNGILYMVWTFIFWRLNKKKFLSWKCFPAWNKLLKFRINETFRYRIAVSNSDRRINLFLLYVQN